MTTCLYDRATKTIAVDSRNTDESGAVFRTEKIEKLSDGRFFLGSGHCLTIAKARIWAEADFEEDERPDFEELFGERADDFGMSCLVISADGNHVILIDNEMTPFEVFDDIVAVGSGGCYARAARRAGASPEQAVEIAIEYDSNSGGPVRTHVI